MSCRLVEQPDAEHDVILDACCTLNIAATGRASDILTQLPYRFVIGTRARAEAQWLVVPETGERELVDFRPLLDDGVLTEERLETQLDDELFIQFAQSLADGEAEAAALAVARGYFLATDDRKARRIVAEQAPAVKLTSTAEMLREWQLTAEAPDSELAELLKLIELRATYRPRRSDALHSWWISLTGDL